VVIELYHNDMSTCAQKVRLVLAEKGLEWKSHHLKLREGPQLKADYLKLNPNGYVPTLIDNGSVVIESNIIMEYLDDTYPEPSLRPENFVERSAMRVWMRQLDVDVHLATGFISNAVAFRHQHLSARPSLEEREIYYTNMPDPVRRKRLRELVEEGLQSALFQDAVRRFRKLFDNMEAALANSPWLLSDVCSLADLAYVPYLTRFEHLNFSSILSDRPNLADWYERTKDRPSYTVAIGDWLNAEYLTLMNEKGETALAQFEAIFNE
jgi:glutathione S-transferase